MRFLVYILIFVVCVAIVFSFTTSDKFSGMLSGLLINLIAGLILVCLREINLLKGNLGLATKSYIFYHNKYIRFSISYLFRIKVNDKYLLVRGHRLRDQFQPVGGVYKYLPEVATYFIKNGNIREDDIIPRDETSLNDLRVRIRGKDVGKFLKWFDSEQARELSPWREFQEELVSSGILDPLNFPHIFYRYLGRHRTAIRFVDFVGGPEVIIADLFELIPSAKQKEELELLCGKQSEEYIFADEDSINKLGVIPKEQFEGHISPTAKWIL